MEETRRKLMKKVTLLVMGWLFLFCLGILIMELAAADVGCEASGSLVTCHNEGTIQSQTTYNLTNGAMWNLEDGRAAWAGYEAGGFLSLDNRFPLSFADALSGWAADSESYGVWWWIEDRKAGKTADINHSRLQSRIDDRVRIYTNITLVSGWQNWNHPIYVYWEMQDVDIWNDGVPDVVNTINGSQLKTYLLNSSDPVYFDSVTDYFQIGGGVGQGIRWWLYDDDMGSWYEEPGNTGFYTKIEGPFHDGQEISLYYEWIDVDICSVVCGGSQNLILEFNDSADLTLDHPQGYLQDFYVAVYVMDESQDPPAPGGSCTLDSCAARVVENRTASTPAQTYFNTTPRSDYYQPWNAYDVDAYWDLPSTITGTAVNHSITLWTVMPQESRIRAYISDMSNISARHGDVTAYTTIKRRNCYQSYNMNISLYSPANASTQAAGSIIFNCNSSQYYNTTEYYFMRNLSLVINDSVNYSLQSSEKNRSTWSMNLSRTLTMDEGTYHWYCLGCNPYDNCTSSWSGNNTLFVIIPEAPISPEEAAYFVKSRPSKGRNILLLIIFLIIYSLIMLVLYLGIIKYNNRKKEARR